MRGVNHMRGERSSGIFEIGAQRMSRRALAGDLAEVRRPLRASASACRCTGREIVATRSRSCGESKALRGNAIDWNLLDVQFPDRQINVAESPEPGVGPGIESERGEFAGQLRVARREELHFVKRAPIARGPGQQRQHAGPTAISAPARASLPNRLAATISPAARARRPRAAAAFRAAPACRIRQRCRRETMG